MYTAPKNRISVPKLVRIALLLSLDVILINLAQFLALFVRFEMDMGLLHNSGYLPDVVAFAPVHTVATVVILAALGIYNSLWAYVSVQEGARIALASAVSGVLQYFLMGMMEMYVPRSFPLLNIIFMTLFIAGERFVYRFLRSLYRELDHHDERKRTLLIGAGEAGAMVLRDLQISRISRNNVVGICDDDPAKLGRQIHGVSVLGDRSKIAELVKKLSVEEIIMAIPTCTAEQRRAILEICQETGCSTKVLPSLAALANENNVSMQLRKVEIEDLLGRDSVRVDLENIRARIQGRRVLVTGGGGSIGSELCRQLAAAEPALLVIFDIYENNAYDIQQELKRNYPDLNLQVRIGSVRDEDKVERIFEEFQPEFVYHAAAHKHVPLMEDSPGEAVKNNIFGTYHVALAAERHEVEAFLLISTDKAVNPTSVMGASKRVCEMIVQMLSRRCTTTRFVAVRFGNVLGSNGSVIPLFRSQIEKGGPVTVTHKDMVRYFMTIPEAVSLVMQASMYAQGGEIFILDMGKPVKIDDLARNMIRLSGFEPDVDIPIVYTGIRPGEKLFEELLLQEEGLQKTANDLIFVGHPNGFSDEELMESLERLELICVDDPEQVPAELARLVKNYRPERLPAGVSV